jgi:hypothetical protein
MKQAAAEYRRAPWRVVLLACLSGLASAVLVMAFAMKMGIV